MANLLPVFDASNPKVGGFIVYWTETETCIVHWVHGAPIPDTFDAAKEFTSKVVQHLLNKQDRKNLDGTNWPSMTAAVQAMIVTWNEKLVKHLRGDELAAIERATVRAHNGHVFTDAELDHSGVIGIDTGGMDVVDHTERFKRLQ